MLPPVAFTPAHSSHSAGCYYISGMPVLLSSVLAVWETRTLVVVIEAPEAITLQRGCNVCTLELAENFDRFDHHWGASKTAGN